jgi:hypothetical protein
VKACSAPSPGKVIPPLFASVPPSENWGYQGLSNVNPWCFISLYYVSPHPSISDEWRQKSSLGAKGMMTYQRRGTGGGQPVEGSISRSRQEKGGPEGDLLHGKGQGSSWGLTSISKPCSDAKLTIVKYQKDSATWKDMGLPLPEP